MLIEEDLDDAGVARNPIPLRSVAAIPLPSGAWVGLATVALLALPRAIRATRALTASRRAG